MTPTRHIYAIAGLVTILTAVSLSSSHAHSIAAAVGGGPTVTVVNTSSNPVPTQAQGTTTVGGTVHLAGDAAVSVNNPTSSPVPVAVQGTPDVNVSTLPAVQLQSGSQVQISNNGSSPVPVQQVLGEHIQRTATLIIPDGTSGGSIPLFDVPAGKVLHVTDASFQILVPTGQFAQSVAITDSGSNFSHFIPAFSEGSSGPFDEFSGSVDGCALEFEGNTTLSIFTQRSAQTGETIAEGSFSGYLTDAP